MRFNSEELLQNELYRFGGMSSLRGFKENSLFASFYTATQTEYQYRPVQGFYLNTVFDVAFIENKLNQNNNILYGVGLGGAILTEAGWLSINFANGIQPENAIMFSQSILHLKLISRF